MVGDHDLEEAEEEKSVPVSRPVQDIEMTHLRSCSSDDLERSAVLLQAFGEDFVAGCGP
jgi:hypothetical protein